MICDFCARAPRGRLTGEQAHGNPARVVRKRFDEEAIAFLLDLRWWDWPPERIFENLDLLCGNIETLKKLRRER